MTTQASPLNAAIEAARALGDQDLRALYDFVLPRLKAAHTAKSVEAGARFRPGDVAQFYCAKKGRTITIKINKINLKSVNGTDVATGTPWRVSPQLLKPVPAAQAS